MRFHACRTQYSHLSPTRSSSGQAGVTNPAVLPTAKSPQPGPVDLTAILEGAFSPAALPAHHQFGSIGSQADLTRASPSVTEEAHRRASLETGKIFQICAKREFLGHACAIATFPQKSLTEASQCHKPCCPPNNLYPQIGLDGLAIVAGGLLRQCALASASSIRIGRASSRDIKSNLNVRTYARAAISCATAVVHFWTVSLPTFPHFRRNITCLSLRKIRAVRRARHTGSTGSVRRVADPFRGAPEIFFDGTTTGWFERATAVK
ncbi:hypothetical protein C8J57DRAFT_1481606 [Mycena rebaudengoi]|nr:hypothetical protein C8J57DRAFT_1481606 [Mycena rebaudengoi]